MKARLWGDHNVFAGADDPVDSAAVDNVLVALSLSSIAAAAAAGVASSAV